MRIIRIVLVLVSLAGVGPAAADMEIEVGGQPIDVPLPEGFVELTPAMSPYYEALGAYIGPGNLRYATLISSEDADALLRGEAIELHRYFNLETQRAISTRSVSTAQFAELRGIMRNEMDELYASVEEQLPGMIDAGDRKLTTQFDADIAVQLGGLLPMPVHLDTDNAIANSMFATVGAAVDGENTGSVVVSATTLVLHVKDKVLFLYAYGEEADLEWTREAVERWGRDVLVANSLAMAEQSTTEAGDQGGIDWGSVIRNAFFGALLAVALLVLLNYVGKRRRQ